MLRKIQIENYALISKLNLCLKDGMTVITGETGAGKSILLNAIGLLTGNRADTSILQNPSQKCIVEAEFDTKGFWFEKFFEENNLDNQNITIVRREISNNGVSRAFINDTPVNLSQLRELGSQLIDIHSQHQTLTISNSQFKFKFLDTLADSIELQSEYKNTFSVFKKLKNELQLLVQNELQSKKDKDYFEFLLDELVQANLKLGETIALEDELKLLSNRENILRVLTLTSNIISNRDENLLSELNKIKNEISGISKLSNIYQEYFNRIQSVYIDLKELNKEIENIQDEVSNDPLRLMKVEERLSTIYKLQKKHSVNSDEELIEIAKTLETKLESITTLDDKINSLTTQTDLQEKQLVEIAEKLNQKRQNSIAKISKNIKQNLIQLGIPDGEFFLQIQKTQTLNDFGANDVQLQFSANKGSEPKDLGKVASGGELSRLMLCIKFLLAQKTQLPTIIFDEIDSGVSGEIANKMALMMIGMAEKMQLLTITHLAQIAAKGSHHLHVIKKVEGEKTNSNIIIIDGENRIQEIAKMLSNSNPTKAAVENAKELLGVL